MNWKRQEVPPFYRIFLVDASTMIPGWPPLSLFALEVMRAIGALFSGRWSAADIDVFEGPVFAVALPFFAFAICRAMFIRSIFSRGIQVSGRLDQGVRSHDIEITYTYRYEGKEFRGSTLLIFRLLWPGTQRPVVVVDPDRPDRSFIRGIFLPKLESRR